jgi:hypothetical protein
VRVNEELSKEAQQALKDLVYEYRDIFVFNDDLGCLGHIHVWITYSKEHSFINVKPGYTQLYQRPYTVSFLERQKIQEEIDKLIKHGVLKPATSNYVSPTLIVLKPDGGNRIVTDYRKLNDILQTKDFRPIPLLQFSYFPALVEQQSSVSWTYLNHCSNVHFQRRTNNSLQ